MNFSGRDCVRRDLAPRFPLAQHGEHHVLCSHLLAIQVIGLDFRKFEDLLCAGREGDVADDANGLAAADHALELEAKFFGLDVEAFEAAVGLAGRNGKDRTEMCSFNVRVVEWRARRAPSSARSHWCVVVLIEKRLRRVRDVSVDRIRPGAEVDMENRRLTRSRAWHRGHPLRIVSGVLDVAFSVCQLFSQ